MRVMRILVVEDNHLCSQVLKKLLSEYGFCDIADDGHEAVKAFKTAIAEGLRYDLVCLDVMMPGMSGRKTLTAIRKMESEAGTDSSDRVGIIMTTVLTEPLDRQDDASGQYDSYMVKPVTKAKLLQELRKLGLAK